MPGISGLTAGKMLKRLRRALHLPSSRPTGSAATGRSATPTDTAAPTARCTSTPPSTGCRSRTSRCPEHFPTSRTTPRSRPTSTTTPTRSACSEHIEFENGVVHAARRREGGGWEHRPTRTAPRAGSTSWSSPTATTGTRGSPTSPASSPARRSTRTTTSTRARRWSSPASGSSSSGIGNSAADIAVELSSKALRQPGHPLDAVERLDRPEVHRRAGPADKYYRTSPHVPLSWQRKVVQVMQPLTPAPTRACTACRRRTTSSSRRTRPSRSSCRCGSAPATWSPKPNVTPPRRRDASTSRTAPAATST